MLSLETAGWKDVPVPRPHLASPGDPAGSVCLLPPPSHRGPKRSTASSYELIHSARETPNATRRPLLPSIPVTSMHSHGMLTHVSWNNGSGVKLVWEVLGETTRFLPPRTF